MSSSIFLLKSPLFYLILSYLSLSHLSLSHLSLSHLSLSHLSLCLLSLCLSPYLISRYVSLLISSLLPLLQQSTSSHLDSEDLNDFDSISRGRFSHSSQTQQAFKTANTSILSIDAIGSSNDSESNNTIYTGSNSSHNNNINIHHDNNDSTYTLTTNSNVTKYRNFGSKIMIFTVVTTWRGYRSSVSLQYSDFKLLDQTVRKELEYVPALLREMPSFPSEKIFQSDSNTLRNWGTEYDVVPRHVPRNLLWSMSRQSGQEMSTFLRNSITGRSSFNSADTDDDNGLLKQNILNNYMVALASLLDHTQYLHAFLNVLEVLPPSSTCGSLTGTDIH